MEEKTNTIIVRRVVVRSVAMFALAALAGCATAVPAPEPVRLDTAPVAASRADALAAVRRATERFRDVKVALAEGYIPDPMGMCVTAEMEGQPREAGGMGVHYLRPDLLRITGAQPRVNGGSTHTDFLRPAVLVYEPQPNGSLELVAVENLVFEKAWREAGNTAPPSFQGVPYNRMADNPATPADEAHMFEPHYDLHLWLYRDNPKGVFAPFNPRVTCAHHKPQAAHANHTGP